MLRHFLTFNIADPLSNDSRGYSDFNQKFSGDNTASQVNHLPRKPSAGGRFIVKVSDVEKTDGIDYTLDSSAGTITWTGFTPPVGNDNITVDYQAIKQWVYDDHPSLSTGSFPRITLDELSLDYATHQLGEYGNYASGKGNMVTGTFRIIVRNRKNTKAYTYDNIEYKNMDLVSAIAEEIKDYFKENRSPSVWKFFDWDLSRFERIRTEEDSGVFRKDATLTVRFFDNPNT